MAIVTHTINYQNKKKNAIAISNNIQITVNHVCYRKLMQFTCFEFRLFRACTVAFWA